MADPDILGEGGGGFGSSIIVFDQIYGPKVDKRGRKL